MKQDILDILEKCEAKKKYAIMGKRIYEITSKDNGAKVEVSIHKDKVWVGGNLVEEGKDNEVKDKLKTIIKTNTASQKEVLTVEEIKAKIDAAKETPPAKDPMILVNGELKKLSRHIENEAAKIPSEEPQSEEIKP